MWEFLKDLVSGAAAFLRLRERKQELDNSPEMQASAEAEERARIAGDATQAVAEGDLEEIRREAAE